MDKSVVKAALGIVSLAALSFTVLLSFFNYEIHPVLWVLDIVIVLGSFAWYVVTQNLVSYVAKRLVEAVVVLFIISTLTFLLVRFIPGGPFDEEKALPPEVMANIEAKYHLNEPILTQYWYYISGIAQGDLGESYKYIGRNVTDIISESLPNTLQLGIYALIICYLIGIPLGIIAAARHNTLIDNATMTFAISGVSLPSFLVGAIAVYFMS
ncbi:MAG: hypothetical protein KDD50_12920, partial [Bdellovibrionales bacterium]|nr:hypothetical protein [Bdellovibrionales bacterium]